jgi:hypothetical protein
MPARPLPRPAGLIRRAALPAAAAAFTLVTGLLPAQAATPGWRVTQVLPASTEIYSTAATSATSAWAVGTSCGDPCAGGTDLLTEHWTGSQWQAIAPPAGFSTSVGDAVTAASSPSNAWVFANQGTNVDRAIALHWNGSSWTGQSTFPAWSGVKASVVIGKRDAWAFAQIISPNSNYVAHYNGTRWSKVAFPGKVIPQDASALSSRNIWAVGQGSSTMGIVHWNGTSWTRVQLPKVSLPAGHRMNGTGIVAITPDNVWADAFLSAGMGVAPGIVLLHWNGKAWSRVSVPYPTVQPGAITQDGRGGVWLTAYAPATFKPYLYHDNGGHWQRVAVPAAASSSTQLSALSWIPGGTSVWAGGASFPDSNPNGISQAAFLKYGP